MPEQWSEAVLCPIFKKGDITKCENYRGIALLDVTYKVMATCINRRLKQHMEKIVGEYQAGFRKDRSTVDQIFILKQLQEERTARSHARTGSPKKTNKTDKDDPAEHQKQSQDKWSVVRTIPSKNRTPARRSNINYHVQSSTRSNNKEKWHPQNEHDIRKKHQNIAFADDVTCITRTEAEMKKMTKNLIREAKRMGSAINQEKTKFMKMETKQTPAKPLKVTTEEGTTYEFEEVNRFKYLGVVITNKNEMNEEIEERIAKANKSVGRLNRFLRSKNVTRRTKKQIYKTIVRPTVLYASETWTLTNEMEQKLEVWERKILRKIYGGIKELDQWRRRTNREIEEIYGEPTITKIIRAQRLRWLGHVGKTIGKLHNRQAEYRYATQEDSQDNLGPVKADFGQNFVHTHGLQRW
ncbi:uncharacterized protein LOC135130772 [Zophobas morio]|uniref:uncharacterized protein LOC135130772 n=1 Tax=Zophobas morio TaxID=2755281 RepID=UPI003082CB0B